jgi:hypothetical protein
MVENPLESYNSSAIPTRWWGGYDRADVDSHINVLKRELEKFRGIIGDERRRREQAEREVAALRGELEQARIQIDDLHEVNKQVVGESEYWREKLRDPDHFMPENVGDMAPLLAELWEGARRGVEAASVRAWNWEQRKAEEHDLAKETWARMTEELAADLVAERVETEAELAQLRAGTNAEIAKQRQVAQEHDSQVRADADRYRQATVARTRDEVQYWLKLRAELVSSLDELAAGLETVRKAQSENFRPVVGDSMTDAQ